MLIVKCIKTEWIIWKCLRTWHPSSMRETYRIVFIYTQARSTHSLCTQWDRSERQWEKLGDTERKQSSGVAESDVCFCVFPFTHQILSCKQKKKQTNTSSWSSTSTVGRCQSCCVSIRNKCMHDWTFKHIPRRNTNSHEYWSRVYFCVRMRVCEVRTQLNRDAKIVYIRAEFVCWLSILRHMLVCLCVRESNLAQSNMPSMVVEIERPKKKDRTNEWTRQNRRLYSFVSVIFTVSASIALLLLLMVMMKTIQSTNTMALIKSSKSCSYQCTYTLALL